MTKESLINIEGRSDLLRDPSSKAVLSSNREALLSYKEKKSQQEDVFRLKEELTQTREELSEIKNLLQTLLTRGNN